MEKQCGWCGKNLGTLAGGPQGGITHGICEDCRRKLGIPCPQESLRELLNRFHFPVLQVDEQVHVLLANDSALHLLSKDAKEVEGNLGGEVIECQHATEPGGCGNTIHCKGCAIRRSVTATFRTQLPLTDVDAYQDITTPEGVKRLHFSISTEKQGGAVYLKVVLKNE